MNTKQKQTVPSAYGAMAGVYDALTGDVPYETLESVYLDLLHLRGRGGAIKYRDRSRTPPMLLDLCCGTDTLTLRFAQLGLEMIGVDRSPEMLSVARDKADALPESCIPPVFLCQEASELDLYGTVDGVLCSLDALNYVPPSQLPAVFHRVHLFLMPGGRFAFDVQEAAHLRSLDGQVFVDEKPDLLCLWRANYLPGERSLHYGVDLFRSQGPGLYTRQQEEHIEYAHRIGTLAKLLRQAGFYDIAVLRHRLPGRVFLSCTNARPDLDTRI